MCGRVSGRRAFAALGKSGGWPSSEIGRAVIGRFWIHKRNRDIYGTCQIAPGIRSRYRRKYLSGRYGRDYRRRDRRPGLQYLVRRRAARRREQDHGRRPGQYSGRRGRPYALSALCHRDRRRRFDRAQCQYSRSPHREPLPDRHGGDRAGPWELDRSWRPTRSCCRAR